LGFKFCFFYRLSTTKRSAIKRPQIMDVVAVVATAGVAAAVVNGYAAQPDDDGGACDAMAPVGEAVAAVVVAAFAGNAQ
jgi:hypothetical protein